MALHSPAALIKSDQAYLAFRTSESGPPAGPVEVELFEFRGKLCSITAIAPSGNYSGNLRLDIGLQRPAKVIAAPDMSYPCVHVEDGIAFIYGTSLDHQRISMMRSTDLINWSSPVVVFTATSGMGFYNTSVAKHTMSGTYRMVVETTDPAYPSNYFVFHFLDGANPVTWAMLPHVFKNAASYVNCPMIRYVGDVLHMPFMEWTGSQHCTFTAWSFDHGATWARGYGLDGETIPLVPATGEGNNNSDMTLCEFEGKTYIAYGAGDQTSWLECKTAVYPGTMEQYFAQFFPTSPPPQNLLPAMTSASTGGVTISASDTHVTFVAWYAADRAPATFWHSSDAVSYPHWWRADFAAPQTISSYSIKCRPGFVSQGPKNFTFQGLNGATWVTLDTRANQTYVDGVAKHFALSTPASYSSFRVLIESNVEGSANLSIGEVELIGLA